MKRIVLALGLLAASCAAQSALAQTSNVRIVGRDTAGNDRPVLVTDTGQLQVSPTAGATGTGAQQVQGTAASAATDSGNPVKVGCVFLTTPTTVATGQRVDMRCTNQGFQYVVQAADAGSLSGVAPAVTAAVGGGQVVKASGGNLYGLNVVSGASAGYVLVTNTTTVPADGAVTPLKCYVLPANSSLDLNLRAAPVYFSTGISVSFSTTGCFTKTASATAFISGDAK